MELISLPAIRKFARRIGAEFGAHRVILFGSHAHGDATGDSDVDLLVILPFRGRSVEQAVRIHLELRPPFPVDLIVRTPQAIQRRLRMGDYFIQTILNEGKVLYEADRR
jgi:predicted nucleotidyltransferase